MKHILEKESPRKTNVSKATHFYISISQNKNEITHQFIPKSRSIFHIFIKHIPCGIIIFCNLPTTLITVCNSSFSLRITHFEALHGQYQTVCRNLLRHTCTLVLQSGKDAQGSPDFTGYGNKIIRKPSATTTFSSKFTQRFKGFFRLLENNSDVTS